MMPLNARLMTVFWAFNSLIVIGVVVFALR